MTWACCGVPRPRRACRPAPPRHAVRPRVRDRPTPRGVELADCGSRGTLVDPADRLAVSLQAFRLALSSSHKQEASNQTCNGEVTGDPKSTSALSRACRIRFRTVSIHPRGCAKAVLSCFDACGEFGSRDVYDNWGLPFTRVSPGRRSSCLSQAVPNVVSGDRQRRTRRHHPQSLGETMVTPSTLRPARL